jgi:hypothetical protein
LTERPFRAFLWGGWFLGLKPQAESYNPFGAQERLRADYL